MSLVIALWLGLMMSWLNLLKRNTSTSSFHPLFFIWWSFLPVLMQLHPVHEFTASNEEIKHHTGGHSLPHLLRHLPAWHF